MEELSAGAIAALGGLAGGIVLGFAARWGRFCTLSAIETATFGGDTSGLRMWGLAIAVAAAGAYGMDGRAHSTNGDSLEEPGNSFYVTLLGSVRIARDAGIAKLGHVALDGTKVRANASKHAAMSYGRMKQAEPELAALVEAWLESSQPTDEREDEEHGEDRRGDELPPHIKSKVSKLAKMRAAKAALEAEAQAEAERIAAERAAKEAERGRPLSGSKPKALDGDPPEKAQRNFTDPESRIMKTGDGYVQAYNAQAAVDAESQVIVACELTNRAERPRRADGAGGSDRGAPGRAPDGGLGRLELLLGRQPRRPDRARSTGLHRDGPAEARNEVTDERRHQGQRGPHAADANATATGWVPQSLPTAKTHGNW